MVFIYNPAYAFIFESMVQLFIFEEIYSTKSVSIPEKMR